MKLRIMALGATALLFSAQAALAQTKWDLASAILLAIFILKIWSNLRMTLTKQARVN